MKKIKKFNYLEWNNSIFISSIKKINFNIVLIVVLDIIFYFLSGYILTLWLQRIQAKMAAFNLPTNVAALGHEKAQLLLQDVKAFYYLIIFSFIVLIIAIIFMASILKGIIWAKTTSTKISLALISKFLALNLVWMSFWFFLIILFSLIVEPRSAQIFIIVSIVLSLYFTNTLYTIFMNNKKFSSIIDAIKLNIGKIHLFAIPYAIIILLFFVIIRIGTFLNFKYSNYIIGIVILAYLAIVRYYASTLVTKTQNS